MGFAQVSWEVSTGDAGRAVMISQTIQQVLAPFRPCFLLADSVLFDTDDFSIDAIRRSLDGIALQALPLLPGTDVFLPRPDHLRSWT